MVFEFYRFRFHFAARSSIHFPPGKSGNIVRGAFGSIFRKIACAPDCRDAAACEVHATCPYARVFEPAGAGPSGLADWPRPFVFRAAHLDRSTMRIGASFHFDVHLFDVKSPCLPYFVAAFEALAKEGIGPHRGLAELRSVEQLNLDGTVAGQLFAEPRLRAPLPPIELELRAAEASPVRRINVAFLTPTELKGGRQLATRPDFPILFGRLRDRLSTLRALYGEGPLEVDFRAQGERAARVRLVRWDWRRDEAERTSTRTHQTHSIGGVLG